MTPNVLVLLGTLVCSVSSLVLQRNRTQPREVNVTQVWNGPESDLSEDSAGHDVWRQAQSSHFVSQPAPQHAMLPPACPSDVPEKAPYWSEKHWPDRTHTACEYVDNCNSMVTNRERHQSIRNALNVTKQMLDGHSIPYVLYGGSAIGQYRCKDVLPWDADCDVMIKKSDVPKLEEWRYLHSEAGSLSNGFVLKAKSSDIPFAVVDTSTGLFCDIFMMDFEEARGTVAVARPKASGTCSQFLDKMGQPIRCERYPLESVYPYIPCELNGVTHSCAHDQATYLATKYGESWNSPDVSTRATF